MPLQFSVLIASLSSVAHILGKLSTANSRQRPERYAPALSVCLGLFVSIPVGGPITRWVICRQHAREGVRKKGFHGVEAGEASPERPFPCSGDPDESRIVEIFVTAKELDDVPKTTHTEVSCISCRSRSVKLEKRDWENKNTINCLIHTRYGELLQHR